MRVVLDTNVIVSGLNFPGNERMVLELARRGRFELWLSSFVLEEVAGVLTSKFGWEEETTHRAIEMLRDSATIIEPQQVPQVIEGNEADNLILRCAVEASADYLVTGDRRHLLPLAEHESIRILNAPRFLSALEG